MKTISLKLWRKYHLYGEKYSEWTNLHADKVKGPVRTWHGPMISVLYGDKWREVYVDEPFEDIVRKLDLDGFEYKKLM